MNRQEIVVLEVGCTEMNETIEYYNRNAQHFCNNTIDVDMSEIHNKFMSYFPKGTHILDAGCGSGRDSKIFLDRGYVVEAIDASAEICGLASDYIGQTVKCISFEEMNYEGKFDGIWACASLLHVSKKELPQIMQKMYQALKTKGILYASFKYGTGERVDNSRSFSDFTKDSATKLFEDAGFKVMECYITYDVRSDRQEERWVNIFGCKF